MNEIKLSDGIYKLRMRLGMSQTELGDRCGVTAMSVSRWEAGTNDPPADCTVQLAKLSDEPTAFWFFLGQIGLAKRDFAGRL